MFDEIGSEFHLMDYDEGNGLLFPRSGSLVFSGRTAIESVLSTITNAHTALLPSYCCESIIEPFIKAGIKVSFYDVNFFDRLTVKIDKTADILFWCNYFGFNIKMPDFDGIIIEDITHSLFSDKQCDVRSDYLVASIRKWEPIVCGGYCSIEFQGKTPPSDFIIKKKNAMELKKDYLLSKNNTISKKEYLLLFQDSNKWLSNNYTGMAIDSWSTEYLSHIDMNKQKEIRRQNAIVIYNELKNISFLFPLSDMDCPLFVPIIHKKRNELRNYLIENNVFCPVHWPQPNGCESNIYSQELSIVCDQRYDESDMRRIASLINAF